MTKTVGSKGLKESRTAVGDHLRNHMHLTNYIHLKNHMHKHSPILANRNLMRDLTVLQRSRPLRDPSASPPSWYLSSVVDVLPKKGNEKVKIQEGMKAVARERKRGRRRLSIGSSTLVSLAASKVFPHDISSGTDDVEISKYKDHLQGKDIHAFVHGSILRNPESKNRNRKKKGKHCHVTHVKSLSDQLNKIRLDVDVTSKIHSKHSKAVKPGEELDNSTGEHSGPSSYQRRKFQRTRRTQTSRDETPVASDSLGKSSSKPMYYVEVEEGETGNQNVIQATRNGCGMLWNWSRIHHRGTTFLDEAGRSLSCTPPDSLLRKNMLAMPIASKNSSSPTKSEVDALPLLVEAPRSTENWVHDYSRKLGTYADCILKKEVDSNHTSQHQNFTQKYRPECFVDLVGQNLVAQALSNAVMKRKAGLLYVFYGPHGTGKTSCARIFARALNCQSLEHPKPCGCCRSCITHDKGRNGNIREVGPVTKLDYDCIMHLLDKIVNLQLPSHHKVLIFDDCNTLSSECFNALSKIVDQAPRGLVLVLVSSNLDVLPHIILSRSQKFFFPKIKDADITNMLLHIASNENIDIDKDALNLIASRSDGSLRDAEMTLDQLSLFGHKISVPLVQELVGLISDETLVDLLDLALSGDTVNTVKNLRGIMETGMEPLALISQLATVITDILAGDYDFTKESFTRKFFQQLQQPLSIDNMEKLRRALRTLSEAEKQLRTATDRLTWLTAALLQFAPDRPCMLPSTSNIMSLNRSQMMNNERSLSEQLRLENGSSLDREINNRSMIIPQQTISLPSEAVNKSVTAIPSETFKEYREIWLKMLEKIQNNTLRGFLNREAKLTSVSSGPEPTVQLMLNSQHTMSQAEKFRSHISQAFESVLRSPVTLEIMCSSNKDTSEIIEMPVSPEEQNPDAQNRKSTSFHKNPIVGSVSESRLGKLSKSRSIVRGKVSLAHVIQQAEGRAQQAGLPKLRPVSIAEKLEQDNLRLEPSSRSLLCWKASTVTPRKLSCLKSRTRKPRSSLKFVPCGKCLSSKSPR